MCQKHLNGKIPFIPLKLSCRTKSKCLTLFYVASHNPRYRSKAKNIINYRQVEKKILDEILGPEVYDTRLRPPGQNKSMTATLVYVNIFVRDFSAISDVTMVG